MNSITKLHVTTLCMLAALLLNAQHNCQETLSLFAENVKTKRFEAASSQLDYLRKNCAQLSYVIYARGETVLAHELKEATDKKQAASDLIQLWKERLQLFPERTKKGKLLPKIGALMLKYNIGTLSEQYRWFDDAFTEDKKYFQNPLNLYYYFELYYKMYQAKTYGVSLESLMEKYAVIQEKLTSEKERSPKNTKAIATLSNNMNVMIEKEATCETLIPMYRKKFQANLENVAWLRKAAGQLDAKGCKEDALFIELVEAIDATAPSAESKLYLHKIHERKGNSVKAEKYFIAYLNLETDTDKKVAMLNTKGKKAAKANQKSKARSFYLEALKVNPNSGSTYLNLARLYGSSANECGTDTFTKKAVYWKAAETARKALNVDSSVKIEANGLISSYMQLAPSKPDVFNKGYKGGEKIAMNCWIGGYVMVPKL
ncbi:hypothetical protein KORDIASMS9_03103 [Kordia sp. SMS9]|uniref:hypothetical protein n=1 Tax=Kordia sp. SMS9 TaxID=2282170 RepID=UPI000E0D7E5C|nr:hypothetical protein [Kordia sp. SMS9]AXG70856.1 hypothetical protein KORDIASMS9_03103 [Kordia sp. SMS9]